MTKPPRLCSCGSIVPNGAFCECQRRLKQERDERHDARRPSAYKRGYDHEWRKARVEYLQAHPQCRLCGSLACVVDHIVPHRGDKRLFWHRANWQPLCVSCHNSIKQRQERST